jgi:hypothetical protein
MQGFTSKFIDAHNEFEEENKRSPSKLYLTKDDEQAILKGRTALCAVLTPCIFSPTGRRKSVGGLEVILRADKFRFE